MCDHDTNLSDTADLAAVHPFILPIVCGHHTLPPAVLSRRLSCDLYIQSRCALRVLPVCLDCGLLRMLSNRVVPFMIGHGCARCLRDAGASRSCAIAGGLDAALAPAADSGADDIDLQLLRPLALEAAGALY